MFKLSLLFWKMISGGKIPHLEFRQIAEVNRNQGGEALREAAARGKL